MSRRAKRKWWRQKHKQTAVGVAALLLLAFVLLWDELPPSRPNDICAIFSEKQDWYDSARRVAKEWQVPEPILMALIHRESSFRARARPPRRRILWILPGPRPSTAMGFSQALDSTWQEYQLRNQRPKARRDEFAHAADFIGWYANEIQRVAGVSPNDPRQLYLAYHEGPTGYRRGSYLAKPWLIEVARKVEARAKMYQSQLDTCRERLDRRLPWRWIFGFLAVAALIFWLRGRDAWYRWQRRLRRKWRSRLRWRK